MSRFNVSHYFHFSKPSPLPGNSCHCGIHCICTWGMLSAASLSGCQSYVTQKLSNSNDLDSYYTNSVYAPSAKIGSCLEDDMSDECH